MHRRPPPRAQATLAASLGVSSSEALRRRCERRPTDAPPGARAACTLFWTVAGNQVGKTALNGGYGVLRPARRRRTALWPFDGTLSGLGVRDGVTLAETYSAEATRRLGAALAPGESKRRQSGRARRAQTVAAWAASQAVTPTSGGRAALDAGFGDRADGEDRFDAFLGLLGLLAVVDHHPERSVPPEPARDQWEGWIVGR